MPLAGFAVENYKAFPDRTAIELRPLTLLFGFNSAGKSALLRALPLLSESISLNGPNPLSLKSDAARGASFSDIQSQYTNSPVVSFFLQWRITTAQLELVVRDIAEHRVQVVDRFSLLRDPYKTPFSLNWIPQIDGGLPSRRYRIEAPQPSDPPLVRNDAQVRFRGLTPRYEDLDDPQIESEFGAADFLLRDLSESTYWLKALRALPARYEVFEGIPQRIEPDGTGATQTLAYDSLGLNELQRDVSRWYQKATAHRLELRRGSFSGKELFSFALIPEGKSIRGNEIIDTGEGMGQVLPVLTLLAAAKHRRLGPHPFVAIEHPELHLHPAAHPALAEFFCEVSATEPQSTILVETHSENFLLRVQLAIARGELPAKHVLVYWVRHADEGYGVADRIEFDDLGVPIGDKWPPGVFSEHSAQARELVLTRRNKRPT